MDTEKIFKALRSFGNFHEIHTVRTFIGFRTNSEGDDKRVEITIKDMGLNPENKNHRYSCNVIDEDGKKAHGNPDNNIPGAIQNVHWSDID